MIGNYVQKVKERTIDRDLYGTVLREDDSRYEVCWQISKNRTLTEWIDKDRCMTIDRVPVKIGKVQFKKLAEELEPAREGWQEHANCAGESTEIFIYGSEHPSGRNRTKLIRICEPCRVKDTCRYEAVRRLEQGWWGGMDEKERYDWAVANLFEQVV